MALPKRQRVMRKKDRQVLFRSRQFLTKHLGLRVVRSHEIPPSRRFMITVSAQTAPRATVRNRLRRRVSEIVRTLADATRAGYRSAITITSGHLPNQAELREEVLSLMKKSGILAS